MTTFALISGAGTDTWYWGPLQAALRERGHRAVAAEMPVEDDAAGFGDYADAVVADVRAAGAADDDLVVVAHSFGGFTAPLVADRVPVRRIVMLTAMVPVPGEAPAQWWEATGQDAAMRAQDEEQGIDPDDEIARYLHDVPADAAATALEHGRGQSSTPYDAVWPGKAWPDVPTSYLLCRDDRLFPAAFVRSMVADRLGLVPDEINGGHHVMLSRPGELADRLVAFAALGGS
ncbi:pimeloyl-ACP methyl ester carboxylesterase [Pseudonocardia sediminis]|uniref:Pimeloyl-ACP methyl ester carboxylesterase n=1 Tax=Pseudonocardia sediminis TaxID=1397368 RepID=A0A4Q7UUY8_PSEST|nr:alpha/beta hydrolase [Pseudonocardia sediminis]RZT84854.1 pimeloyl-ACP methyl ester carboxylesterase [Pseudonocardia sediminis]